MVIGGFETYLAREKEMDRYETLLEANMDENVGYIWNIIEMDTNKGTRETMVDSRTGRILSEELSN